MAGTSVLRDSHPPSAEEGARLGTGDSGVRISTGGPPVAIELDFISELYRKYADDLRRVRAAQASLYREYTARGGLGVRNLLEAPSRAVSPLVRQWTSNHVPLPVLLQLRRVVKALFPGTDLDPQSDDIDCEIAYLLIRALRPQTAVEISPCGGWSTTWLLSALRDAGKGRLYSFDLIDDSLRTVPPELSRGRWVFTQGDVRKKISSIPESIDFLLLDAEHSSSFADWYLQELIPRLAPGACVGIDDIFNPELERSGASGESSTVLKWLKAEGIEYFTAAPSARPDNYAALVSLKDGLAFGGQIHTSTMNPVLFFLARNPGRFPQRMEVAGNRNGLHGR